VIRYVTERVLLLIPTLLGILIGVFLMLHAAPGDPVEALMDIQTELIPKEQIEQIRRDLGLDRPLYEQYLKYVGRVVRGDLGTSFRTQLPILDDIKLNFMATVHLALGGLAVALLIGLPAGIISAVRRNTIADYLTLSVAVVGLSAPSFWIGILLLYVFSFRLRWFPILAGGGGDGSLASTMVHLVLPAIVVGASLGALIARLTRSAMLEALNQDYVRTARAKGLPGRTVVAKHVLRNAGITLVAAASTMFAYLLTGSVVVEIVFSRKGLGQLMITAITGRDFPLAQALILVFGTVIVVVNLFTDIAMTFLDPRVSYQ
jgi:ABC-type dipeptide/oligopeptide/nickel transport system permease component